ncbi:MAG: hypothetical protein Q8914_06885 [Bacteroidota bacterium]|nr:hypothetical protein [Bacteroidota bacterium]
MRLSGRCLIFLAGLCSLCTTINLSAQETPNGTPVVHGYVRGVAAGLSERADLSSIFGEVAVNLSTGGQPMFFKADVRFREGWLIDDRKTEVEVKEAYAGYRSDKLDVYLGNQLVIWGRTDGFNPTDNIHSFDYFFQSPEPDDQRLGNFMLRSRFRPFGTGELELVAIPLFRPSVYRYDLFQLGEYTHFRKAQLPSASFENGSFAVRFNVELPAIGFSVSYFNGYDPFYGFSLYSFSLIPGPEIVYQPDFYRKQTIGTDVAVPLGSVVLRGEAACNLTSGYKLHRQVPNPDLTGVAGLEFGVAGATVIVQYVYTHTIDYWPLVLPVLTNPLDPLAVYDYARAQAIYEGTLFNRKIRHQQERDNYAATLTWSRSFAYDVLSVRASGYYNVTSDEFMICPEVKWKLSEALAVSARGNWMKGPEKSVFDYAGKVLGGICVALTAQF